MSRRKGLLVDPDRCMACRACQVACKEWNELPAEDTVNRGSFENPADLNANLYNRIRFIEQDAGAGLEWNFFSQRCLHCEEAGCVQICPTGALFHRADGIVAFDQGKCISCKYCLAACPFDVPRYNEAGRIAKCHLCADRVEAGLEPACAKVCPTASIRFGERSDLVRTAKAAGKNVYGETALGGLGVMYALSKPPETYDLPATPQIPASVATLRDFVRPLGWLGFWGALGATILHYVTIGPKNIVRDHEQNGGA